MQLAQLLARHLRRRVHHQILGALVHWKEHDFAQVLFPAEQHHDAVDAGRDAVVRRRTERKRAQHAAEFLFQRVLAVAGDGERLAHDVGTVIADGAGGKLDSVADDVVLDRLDGQDRLAFGGGDGEESSGAMFGIENGLWEKSILFSSSFHSYIGKSTIQQNSKRSFLMTPSSSPILLRAAPANLMVSFGFPATKNMASPS